MPGAQTAINQAGPGKDTVIVQSGQQVTCDFDASNPPGQWMTHCHNLYHAPQSGSARRAPARAGGNRICGTGSCPAAVSAGRRRALRSAGRHGRPGLPGVQRRRRGWSCLPESDADGRSGQATIDHGTRYVIKLARQAGPRRGRRAAPPTGAVASGQRARTITRNSRRRNPGPHGRGEVTGLTHTHNADME